METNFSKLWHLNQAVFRNLKTKGGIREPTWWDHIITATASKDLLNNGKVEYPKGTKVRVWMVSRFGDVGIIGDLSDKATGYDLRVDPDKDLTDLIIAHKI